MNVRRTLIALLTFLGGLYFVLEFVVPPTLPFATTSGVMLDKRLPALTVRTASGMVLRQEVNADASLFAIQRDATGELIPKQLKSRDIGVGDVVTVRTRTVTVGAFRRGAQPVNDGGVPIVAGQGEVPYPTDSGQSSWLARSYQRLLGRIGPGGEAIVGMLDEGEKVNMEVRGAEVTRVERGSVDLLIAQKRATISLSSSTLVMREKRRADPEEIEVHQANLGDSLRIGPNTLFRDQRDTAAQFNAVLGTLALGMGLLSLGMVNYRKLKKRDKEWYTALLFFGAIILGAIAGLDKYAIPGTNEKAFSDIIIIQVFTAMGSSIFSLLAFYLASAAYRAFRVRTAEAALMMITSLIVMLGQTPFGMYLTGWVGEKYQFLWLPSIAGWILRVPNSAFVRALLFGAMLGAIATALRYWLSLERTAGMEGD